MYIYDTGQGFNIIVDYIDDLIVRSHCDLQPNHHKISRIRWNNLGEAYFNRFGLKVYIADLGPEYTIM